MRVRNFSKVVAVATTVVWMSGCSSTSTSTDSVDTAPVVQEPVVEVAKPIPVAKEPTVKTVVMSDEEMAKAAVAKLKTVFYFDFDKTVIHADAFEDFSAHAK